MSSPITLCIISGISWAIFDLTRKLALNYIHPKVLLILFTLIQIFFFLIWCLTKDFYFYFLPYFLPGIILVIIGIFSALIFLKSIKESDLSLTIPLLSFSPLFSSLFSLFFLGEQLNNVQYLGIFAIIFGTLVLYSDNFNFFFLVKSISNIRKSLSAKLMLLVSFCWSLTPVLDKICLQYSSINFHGFIQSIFTFFILFLLSINELKKLKSAKLERVKLILFTILIGTFATILQFYAILSTLVPIMESIKRAMGQFSALIFGKIFFSEKITKQKVLGIIFISIGVNIII